MRHQMDNLKKPVQVMEWNSLFTKQTKNQAFEDEIEQTPYKQDEELKYLSLVFIPHGNMNGAKETRVQRANAVTYQLVIISSLLPQK